MCRIFLAVEGRSTSSAAIYHALKQQQIIRKKPEGLDLSIIDFTELLHCQYQQNKETVEITTLMVSNVLQLRHWLLLIIGGSGGGIRHVPLIDRTSLVTVNSNSHRRAIKDHGKETQERFPSMLFYQKTSVWQADLFSSFVYFTSFLSFLFSLPTPLSANHQLPPTTHIFNFFFLSQLSAYCILCT